MKIVIDIREEDFVFFRDACAHLKIKEDVIDTKGSRAFLAIANGRPLTELTKEIEELAEFHSTKVPVVYGDGEKTEEDYIDLCELGIILREVEDDEDSD